MKYRAEIDGLRALAVIPVILFHADFELFSGGFVGVDIFFVISGYLITTILIEDIENKRFSIVNFYERRARRILPALFLVMLACIPFAYFWMLPGQLKDFSQSLVAVSLFGSNILFWRESGYFAAVAEEKPLLHTWSLAVEEQYYVLFPIFLVLAWRFGKNRVFWMIVVIATFSLLLSEWGWRNKPTANFYLAPTRAWELFAGSIAAFIVQKQGVHRNDLLSIAGLLAIIFSIFFYDDTTPFPSMYALVPILGVVLLLLYADKDTFAAKLLSTKGIVGIGLISYSAYLWHQPLFAFARIRSLEHPTLPLMSALSAVSILLGYLSWRYIEKPFRDKNTINRTQIFSVSFVFLAGFIAVGMAGNASSKYLENIWLERQTFETRQTYELLSEATRLSNWGATSEGVKEITPCVFNVRGLNNDIEARILECAKQHERGILVLGDSHAIDLFGVIASREKETFLIGVTKGGCRPHDNLSHCHYDRVLEFLNAHPKTFKLVIYEQAGFYLLRQTNGPKGTRSMFSSLGLDEPVRNIIVDEEHIRLTSEFLEAVSEFAHVNWFLPRVEPHISSEFILKNGCAFDYSHRPNLYQTFTDLDNYIATTVSSLSNNRLNTVSQNEMFQFNFPSDFMNCDAVYWVDGDHLSAAGEEYFGRRVTQELFVSK